MPLVLMLLLGLPAVMPAPAVAAERAFGNNNPAAVIPNGATSAKATFTTNGDTYHPGAFYPGAFVFTARIVPLHQFDKTITHADGTDANLGMVTPGEKLTVTLVARAIGDQALADLLVTDPIPAGLTPVADSATVDGAATSDAADGDATTRDGQKYTFTLGNLAVGGSRTMKFLVTVDPSAPTGTPILNTATIAYSAGGNVFSGADEVRVTPGPIDLAVAKTTNPVSVRVNGETTVTVTVTAERGTATGVTVSDQLPDGLTALEFTASQGAYDSGRGVWTVGTLTEGQHATLTMRTRVDTAGSHSTTARLTGSDQPDEDASDDTGSAAVTGTLPPLVTDITVDEVDPGQVYQPGDTVLLSLNPADLGASDATTVTVVNTHPAAWSAVSASGDGWTCSVTATTTTCVRERLPADDGLTGLARVEAAEAAPPITLLLRIPDDAAPGQYTNTASITTAVDETDLTNNEDHGVFTIEAAMPVTVSAHVPRIALAGVAALALGLLLVAVVIRRRSDTLPE